MVIMNDSKAPEIYDIPRGPRWTYPYNRYGTYFKETDYCCLGKRRAPAHKI